MKRPSILKLMVALAVPICCCATLWAGTDPTAPTIMILLDASGSMWGKAGGTTKIEAAKRVLGKVLSEMPEASRVGLAAFGHRKQADCRDIEVLVAPRPGGAAAAAESAARINPRGKTPIADALTLVAGQITGDETTTLVLISDGIETCGGDPCRVAAALRQQGTKLMLHVVGFGVSSAEAEQLKCIAQAGGGRYFGVENGDELAAALTAVREHLVTAAPLPEPPKPPEPPPVQHTEAQSQRVKIAGPGTVELNPAAWVSMPPYSWSLADPESGETVAGGQAGALRVKPGSYQVLWRQSEHGGDPVALSEVVRVASGETVKVPIDTGIRLTLPQGMKAPYAFRLVDGSRNTVAQFRGHLGPAVVAAGTYHLIWRQTEHGHDDLDLGQIELVSGGLNDLVLSSGFVVTLPDWLPPPYRYQLTDAKGQTCTFREAGPQLMAPGGYRLTWRQTEHGHSDVNWGEFTVTANQLTRLEIASGITFLAGTAPPPYRIYVEEKSSGRKAEMAKSWGPMPLPPGTYRVDLREVEHGGSRTTLVDELVLAPGKLLEIEF